VMILKPLILPVVNVLSIGLYVAIRKMRRVEKIPFLASFLVIGSLTVVAESLWVVWSIASEFSPALYLSGDIFIYDIEYPSNLALWMFVGMSIQLVPALLGATLYVFLQKWRKGRRPLSLAPSTTE
jgi:hypothetical protein